MTAATGARQPMLVLYHGANSVCSVKVRIVLAEKGLAWESRHVDLPRGEHLAEDYLRINPRAVVPVLDHDGVLIRESTVICEYLDGLDDTARLVPAGRLAQARMRIWGVNTAEYHDSVNTLTFASFQRRMLQAKTPEELAARWKAMPDKIRVRKTLDLMEHGAESIYVPVAFRRLQRMCAEMEEALAEHDWLLGPDYSLADAMLTAYVFRLHCLGMQALWESRYPRVAGWAARVMARPSWAVATAPWLDAAEVARITAIGRETFTRQAFPEFL
ncbi:MAG: glutathione S-transferase family protein [Candidatus Puniceispirillaceae bacterium]